MSDTTGARVALSVDGGLAHLRLTRPEARNAIDTTFCHELHDAVARLVDVRALLITAVGPAFTVGGDLAHLRREPDSLPELLEAMISEYHASLVRLAELPVPVVCAVQGAAAGGGLGLLWIADVVIAADDLKLTTGFAALGLAGDGGSTWAVPRLAGMSRARDLFFGERVLSAEEALDWGLVTRVVAPERLHDEALDEARRLAAGPAAAHAHIKRLLRASPGATWEQQLAAELRATTELGATADAREGIAAFAERRPPRFDVTTPEET